MSRRKWNIACLTCLFSFAGFLFASETRPDVFRDADPSPGLVSAGDSPAAGLPVIASSASPYHATLKQYTFDAGLNPDPQGWTAHDLTEQIGSLWHVDDFAGLSGYEPLAGNRSFWCGVRPGTLSDPLIPLAPGYGDRWFQILMSRDIATVPGQAIELQGRLSCDLVPGDFLEVQYMTEALVWNTLATYTGTQFGEYFWQISGPAVGSTLWFRFVVNSSFLGSDESDVNTQGAVILDDLSVWHIGDLFPLLGPNDFESTPVGGHSDGEWSAVAGSAFGNFGGLVSGASVVQSGATNTSHVWSFFNGSPNTYACGGYPGQAAIPTARVPGSTRLTDYLCNEIRSPFIDLSVDIDNQPVDPDMVVVAAEFDVYADLAFINNRVMYTKRWRFMVGGAPTAWTTDPTLHYSNVAQWSHVGPFTFVIPSGATHVQIGLVAIDTAYETGFTGACHSQSPLFDNVTIHRMFRPYRVYNTDDSGAGSLRQAILTANSVAGADVILFDIAGNGPHTITPASPLPAITGRTYIDGFSQSGSLPNLYATIPSSALMKIDLNGTSAGPGADGLHFSPGSTGVLRGLVIGGFSGSGVHSESSSLIVTGCYIGTDVWGSSANPNGTGIHAVTVQTDIGGPFNEERMVIAGNDNDGIRIEAGSGPILNTYVGFNANGEPLGNNDYGIHVTGGTLCQVGQPAGTPCAVGYTDRVRIGYNGLDGIRVDPAATGVTVAQVHFENNGWLPVDLGGDGPTSNDALDLDTGANALLNHPDLATADGTTISGVMNGAPNLLHRIEFFSGDNCSTLRYLGYQNVTTDGTGAAPIAFSCHPIPPASQICAVATAGVNSSELSPCITSMNTPPGAPLVTLYDTSGQPKATIEYEQVSSGGNTFLNPAPSPPPVPGSWNVGPSPEYWDISTDAAYSNGVHVFLHYDQDQLSGPENMLRLLHYDNGSWVDITDTVDPVNNRVGGTTTTFSPFVLALPAGATAVDRPLATHFALHPNIPNPFNPATSIEYDVPAGGASVSITIYDARGRHVRALVRGARDAGHHRVQWNGDDDRGVQAASGVYFYRMIAGSFRDTRKMVLLK